MDPDGDAFIGDNFIEMDCSGLDQSDDSCTDGMIKQCTPLKEQDRFLPIANIAKIMKKVIPENGKIAKDARECIQECVSEFISFITSEASDRCHMEKRKTINGEDILFAMCNLGFENYIEPLKLYLQKYRESTKTEKSLANNESGEDNSDEFSPSEPVSGQVNDAVYYQTDQISEFQL